MNFILSVFPTVESSRCSLVKRVLVMVPVLLSAGPPAGSQEIIDRVIASVNGSVITRRQLDRKIEQLRRVFARKDGPTKGVVPPPEALRREALDQLIDEELLLQRWQGAFRVGAAERLARRSVDEQIKRLQEDLGKEGLEARLAEENQTLEEFRTSLIEETKRQILIRQSTQAWIDEFLLTPVSDGKIENYLEENPRLKKQAGGILVRLILLRVPKNASEVKQKAIHRKALRILNKARIGEPFEELVETYSEHEPSKERGGLYTLDSPTVPFPEFAPVFEAKVGQVYPELIRIPAGWCIVKVVDKKNLHNVVRRAMAEEEFSKALKRLRDDAVILYDENLFREPLTEAGQAGGF